MEEFNTIEKVQALFQAKGIGDPDDIYLALLKDTRKYSGMADGMEYPYTALLLDITNDGIGYYRLVQPKFSLVILMQNLVVDPESYTFIPNNSIKSIEVKKFGLLDNKRKNLIIKTNDKKTHYLYGLIEDDLLPYHNGNMQKLIARYSVK
ncbi:MAG: hypothetical protein J5685_08510 [Clostridiales bacterium]|nr:hypothetical protein [Clostridiales bacterium]